MIKIDKYINLDDLNIITEYYNISLICQTVEEFEELCKDGYDFIVNYNLVSEWFDNRYKMWSKEEIIEVAKTCLYFQEFKALHPRMYYIAKEMRIMRKEMPWLSSIPHNKKWKPESILEVMKTCKSLYEFRTKHPVVYDAYKEFESLNNYEWAEEHIAESPKIWTEQEVRDEVKNKGYKYKSDLRYGSPRAYSAAHKLGIINDLGLVEHERKWTPENIKELALKYNSRSDFYNSEGAAYQAARQMGILQDVLSHMPICKIEEHNKNQLIYCIYLYLDEDTMTGYVGLTKDLKGRHKQHQNPYAVGHKYDTIASYFKSINKPLPEPIVLYEHLLPEEASALEISTYYEYVEKGWNMLNDQKELGALGGSKLKWSFSAIKELAEPYEYKLDFRKAHPQAYHAAQIRGWLDSLGLKNVIAEALTEEQALEIAHQYTDLMLFRKEQQVAYKFALRHNLNLDFLDPSNTRKHGYWNDDNVTEAAKTCKTLKEFRAMKTPYQYALDHNLLETFTWLKVALKYWTLEEATELAKQCTSWAELRKLDASCEGWCHRHNVEFPWFIPTKTAITRAKNKKMRETENKDE